MPVRLALLLVLAGTLLPAPAAHAEPVAAVPAVEGAVASLVGEGALRGARIGVAVADLGSGQMLVSNDADRPMVPASNQKLLTAAAALLQWGPTYRFVTRVLAEEAPRDGVIEGPLWVVGEGDPSLVSERLWKLAEELRLLGLRAVRGGLRIDASHFDSQRVHRDWQPVSSRAYHARVSAFAANYSSFRIEAAAAAKAGKLAQVRVAPEIPYFRVKSEAPTIARPGLLELFLTPLPDGSGQLVRVSGAIALGRKPKTWWRSVEQPGLYAAQVLRSQLEAQGIRVAGDVRFGRVPEGAVELLAFEGEPLGEIVGLMNKYSNNFIAEQLVKAMGAESSGDPGGWENGTLAIRDLLAPLGAVDERTVVADGSGLSPRNRVSASSLVRLILYAARDFTAGAEFLASLPHGGLDGTLEDRMEGGPAVRAKTGHLSRIASLSGVVEGGGGRRLAFSVLVNGGRGGRVGIDDAIDRFVASLAALPEPRDELPAAGAPESAQGSSGD